jgi:hypothetical protein
MKTPEPEDVANAVVEALQTGRFDVYVPKSMVATVRLTALLPRRMTDALGRWMRADTTLTDPDRSVRAAYDARMAETISDPEKAAAPADEREKETV